MDEKVELETPLAFARKHLDSSAIYGGCLTRTLSHSLLDAEATLPFGTKKESRALGKLCKTLITEYAFHL